jgi:hypothetical protein
MGATVTVNPLSGGGAGLVAELHLAAALSAGHPLGATLFDIVEEYARSGLANVTTDAEREEVYREAMSGVIYGDPALALGPKAP